MKKTSNHSGKDGYYAQNPIEIPAREWLEIFKRVKEQIKKDNVLIIASGVAFYFFLALIPAIAVTIALYGLIFEPGQVEHQMRQIAEILPEPANDLVAAILRQTAEKPQGALGWGLIVGVLLGLWIANFATTAVFKAINIAYNETNKRSFLKSKFITLIFTVGIILTGILSMAFVVGFPAFINWLSLPSGLQSVLSILRWIILALIVFFALGITYKIAPDREHARFRWVNVGSIIATVIWIMGSLFFSFYVNNLVNFDRIFGGIAAVIILMIWFLLTAFIIILGAKINAEAEHQTGMDTTSGDEKPMGQRGAYYADRSSGQDSKE
jgi:membrane protein